jgi:uncharacterized protein YoaH (UPF0181 family)
LYAGLYIPSLSPDELQEAVEISKKNGAEGVSLFDISALTDEHLKVIKELNKKFNSK